jgi:NAD(P)H-dependent FMN reductase
MLVMSNTPAKSLKIHVILGSTREGRYGDKPAHYILDRLNQHPLLQAELLDLRDFALPMFDQALSPGRISTGSHGHPVADRWAAKIAEADGYVVIAAEYNHGYTAVLKNAIDWIYHEWVRKPIAFVGYGGVGGARAIEQLRQVAVELQMAPIKQAVHLPLDVYLATMKQSAPAKAELFAPIDGAATAMIDHLLWWTEALKQARALQPK